MGVVSKNSFHAIIRKQHLHGLVSTIWREKWYVLLEKLDLHFHGVLFAALYFVVETGAHE